MWKIGGLAPLLATPCWLKVPVFTQVTRAHITAKDLPCIIAYKANLKPNAHTVALRAIHHDLLLRSYFSLLAPFRNNCNLVIETVIFNQNYIWIKSRLVIVTWKRTILVYVSASKILLRRSRHYKCQSLNRFYWGVFMVGRAIFYIGSDKKVIANCRDKQVWLILIGQGISVSIRTRSE